MHNLKQGIKEEQYEYLFPCIKDGSVSSLPSISTCSVTGYCSAGGCGFLDDAADAFLAQGIAPGDPLAFARGRTPPSPTGGAAEVVSESSADEDGGASADELDDNYRPKRSRRRPPSARQRKGSAGSKLASPTARGSRGKPGASKEPAPPPVRHSRLKSHSVAQMYTSDAACPLCTPCVMSNMMQVPIALDVIYSLPQISLQVAPEGLFKPGGRGSAALMQQRKQQQRQQTQTQAQSQSQSQAKARQLPPPDVQKRQNAEATRLQGLLRQELALQVIIAVVCVNPSQRSTLVICTLPSCRQTCWAGVHQVHAAAGSAQSCEMCACRHGCPRVP